MVQCLKIKNRSLEKFQFFSFCNDKILTTGTEGGIILKDKKILKKFGHRKIYRRNYNKALKIKKNSTYQKIYETLGSNLRLTEIQSAVGLRYVEKFRQRYKIKK